MSKTTKAGYPALSDLVHLSAFGLISLLAERAHFLIC
jgi:hypothetical protein